MNTIFARLRPRRRRRHSLAVNYSTAISIKRPRSTSCHPKGDFVLPVVSSLTVIYRKIVDFVIMLHPSVKLQLFTKIMILATFSAI